MAPAAAQRRRLSIEAGERRPLGIARRVWRDVNSSGSPVRSSPFCASPRGVVGAAMGTRSSHHSVGHWLGLVALVGLILLGAFGFDRVRAQEALAIDPARFGMPDASTAGVQAGVTLTPYTGPMTITTPGAVIENVIFNDTVTVLADNVTFRNCEFRNFTWYAVNGLEATNLTVEHCDVIGYGSSGTTGLYGTGNFIANDIRGMAIGIQWTGHPGVIRDNYIHDLQNTVPGAHFDGITVFGHGGGQLLIEHNTIENSPNCRRHRNDFH